MARFYLPVRMTESGDWGGYALLLYYKRGANEFRFTYLLQRARDWRKGIERFEGATCLLGLIGLMRDAAVRAPGTIDWDQNHVPLPQKRWLLTPEERRKLRSPPKKTP